MCALRAPLAQFGDEADFFGMVGLDPLGGVLAGVAALSPFLPLPLGRSQPWEPDR